MLSQLASVCVTSFECTSNEEQVMDIYCLEAWMPNLESYSHEILQELYH